MFAAINPFVELPDSRFYVEPNKIRVHSCLAFVLMLVGIFYGIIGLEWDAKGLDLTSGLVGQLPSWQQIIESPYIFSHQTQPRSIWSMLDFAYGFDMVASLAIFTTMAIITGSPDQAASRYRIQIARNEIAPTETKLTINDRGKIGVMVDCVFITVSICKLEINKQDTCQIINEHRKLMHVLQISLALFLCGMNVQFYTVALFNTKVYSLSVWSMLYWLILFPLMIFYCVYG